MVEPITEHAARAALKSAQSEASNPGFYVARRRKHGWLFVWRIEHGDPPVGTRSWVVADNGRARILRIGERADDVIGAEVAEDASGHE